MSYKKLFYKIYNKSLKELYEINSEIDFAVEMVSNLSAKDFILGKSLSAEQITKISGILEEHVLSGIPLQYLVGMAFFAGSKYYVNENTLIPRPETEIIIDSCKKNNEKNKRLKILDIGTGSGCISIELAKHFLNSEITAVDNCQDTLDVARKNACYHSVSDRIDFLLSDIYSNVKGKFDIIVSNPPYIPYNRIDDVADDVYRFEPHGALFAENDGYYFYEKIIKDGNLFLKDGGLIVFEIGIEQSAYISRLLVSSGFENPSIERDLDDIERVVYAHFYC